MSDRTASRLGMRRPWMITGLAGGSLGILIIALAPASRSSSSAGVSPSCSITRCSPPWWRCCRTRSRLSSAAWSPVSWASARPSGRCAVRSWSSCSPPACSSCSWPHARSAGFSCCFSRSP
jgi:hypothetical protein